MLVKPKQEQNANKIGNKRVVNLRKKNFIPHGEVIIPKMMDEIIIGIIKFNLDIFDIRTQVRVASKIKPIYVA